MRHRLALLSLLLAGAFLLGWNLAGRSLWWDEIIIVLINREPVSSIFGSLPYLSYTSGETLFPWEPAALLGRPDYPYKAEVRLYAKP